MILKPTRPVRSGLQTTWENAVANRNREYLLARAKQERELAEQAASPQARAVHLRLADGYENRASADEEDSLPSDHVIGRGQQQSQ
jgi:hypothetical protein